MKKPETVLKEYCNRANDETLRLLASRFSQRLSGDVPEAINCLAQSPDMDRLFSSARTANELYDVVDAVQDCVEKEIARRYREDRPDRGPAVVETDADGRPQVKRRRFTAN